MEESTSPSIKQLVASLYEVQAVRSRLYNDFDQAFKRFLSTKQESFYQQSMVQLTSAFSACSLEVRKIAKQLEELRGGGDLAEVIGNLQSHEREKLRLTLTVHKLKQAQAFQMFSWQEEGADILEPRVLTPLGQKTACCSGGCGAGGSSGAAEVVLEPSEVQFTSALREAVSELNNEVVAINDCLEELRYMVEELEGS